MEYHARFDGLTIELSCCKVALPTILLVMSFLCGLHSHYSNIVEQFCSSFKQTESATINSIISDVSYHDEFAVVDSKKGKQAVVGSGSGTRVPATAAANTDWQGQVWQSPLEWLSKYGIKRIKGRWTRALAGTGICPMCHHEHLFLDGDKTVSFKSFARNCNFIRLPIHNTPIHQS